MSNTNNNLKNQTSNALHNAIMEASGKDRPPMLAPDIRDQLNAEAEAVQIILTRIDNDIYSIIDVCPNACEMWKAIERLKQDESINVQDLETNLYWEFGKFTSRDGELLESHYLRLYKMMNELSQELKTVSYHKLYDILKQHQNEVNELRAERLARTANPLALVAQQQLVYHPQNHPNHYTQNSLTRSQQAATRNKGKEIVNSPPPTYDQEPTMVAEDDEMSKDKEIDKHMALISLSFKKIYKTTNKNLRTSSNTSRANQDNTLRNNRGTGYDNQRVVNVSGARENVGTQMVQQSGIQCYNCKEYGHVARECQKPKWEKDASYYKEKMLLCKQEEARGSWILIQGVTLDAADNSGPIFDAEPLYKVQNNDNNYNVFAIESEHPEQPESVNGTYPVEQDEHNIIIDSLDMSYDREHDDQDDNNDLAKERDFLASLIEKLKYEIDDSKNKANNELSKTNQLMFKDLKKFQAELDRYHDVNYASKVAIDCAKAKGDLMSYKMESEKSFNKYTRKINDLNQTISEMKKELFAHQETISIMSQEKEAQIKFYKTREDKEIEKVIALENKVKALDDIVYKTGQSVQTMNMLNHNCKTSFVKPEFLKKAQRANPRLYDISCYNDNLALMLALESNKMIRLAQESRSKLSAEEGPNYALMAYLSSSSDSKIVDNCKKGLGYEKYNAVPPPYTRNFMPLTPDLSFTGLDEFINKPVVENRKYDEEVSKVVRKSDDSLIIEDWVSDWNLLFQPLFDELLTPPQSVDHPAPEVIAPIDEVVAPVSAVSTGSPSSTTLYQDAPSPSNSQTTPETQYPILLKDVEEDNHDLDVSHMNNDPFFGITIPENDSEASSLDVIPTIVQTAAPNSEHVNK
ncbi:retrovirus-related pol polyprotein from transposon TNT 1-94 [Tanacetum coccineum]